jgi:fumarate reductase flavoprotein subunit
LITHGGITVNHDLQVLHQNGMVIPGLYAVGETLGCGQLMGNAVLSGMSVGPAITLGRIAARNACNYALMQSRRDFVCESANSPPVT